MPRTDPLKKIGKLIVLLSLINFAIFVAGFSVTEIIQFLFHINVAG